MHTLYQIPRKIGVKGPKLTELTENGTREELKIIFWHVFESDTQTIRNRSGFHGSDFKANYLPSDEHVELLKSLPKGFPDMYIFRHEKGNGGARPGQQFGKDYLYKWWRKACENLAIEGVSLYPGTKHSTVMDMRKRHSPETCKRMTGHRTNKAFDRYLMEDPEELRSLYEEASPDKPVINFPGVSGQSK